MSLITDKVFYSALKSNASLLQAVGERIYNTSIPVPDDEIPNEPVPYIIISFDGMENTGFTKDNNYEGDTDNVKISVEVTAPDRETLGELTTTIRSTILDYFEDDTHDAETLQLIPRDYSFSASPIRYDSEKPCYYQTLTYQCDTNT